MEEPKRNIIIEKSYAFSVRIINLYKKIVSKKKEYVLSRQIVRSGTSIGANIEEAIGGMSKKDFTARMQIAYKEARETHYWLRLLKDTQYIDEETFKSLEIDCTEILKILFKIIESSK